ncbi:MAG: hypothetical protein ACK5AN_18580 [Planctomyces sp.]
MPAWIRSVATVQYLLAECRQTQQISQVGQRKTHKAPFQSNHPIVAQTSLVRVSAFIT